MEVLHSLTPAETAGTLLGTVLAQYAGRPTLLLVSGGSALELLAYVPETALGPHVTLSTLDERFSTDPTVNNFTQLKTRSFFTDAQRQGVSCIETTIQDGETLVAAGERYAAALRQWRTTYPEGVIIVTVGVGSDGHTAGIFRGPSGVDWSGAEWVAAYHIPALVNPHSERITVTDTFLRTQVAVAVGYAVGAKKAAIVAQLSQPTCDSAQLPACVLRDIPTAYLITDQ